MYDTAATFALNNQKIMKKIIRFAFAALMLVAFASCNGEDPKPGPEPEKPTPEKPVLNEDIKFTLEVKETTANSAKVQVQHDGTTADTWYAFATDSKNVNEALTAKIVELTEGETVKGLKKQTNYTYNVNGLNPETEYTFIVFGITSDGTTYGKPATIEFKTKRGEVVMEENPAWTVAYNGPAELYETMYEHTVTVTSTDDNKYFITAYSKDIADSYDVKTIATDALNKLKEAVAYYQQQPGYEALTIQDMLFTGNGIDAIDAMPGDWCAYAIGVDAEGELSGLYAVNAFTISEEEATEAYASWIGNWTFTGANGVAFDVTIHKGINNEFFYLSGWEGPNTDADGNPVDGNVSDGIEIPMYWYEEDGMWAILTTDYGTTNFGTAGTGNIWVLGSSGEYIWPVEDLPICVGVVTEEGARVVVGYSDEGEAVGEPINMEYMMYIAAIGEKFYTLSGVSEWPTFPLTITPREAAAQASVAEKELKNVCKFTLAPKPVKTFCQPFNAVVR